MSAVPKHMPRPDAYSISRPATRLMALLLAVLGVLAFTVRGYHDEHEALHFRDFKQPYSSARCVVVGCDPYSETDTLAAFLGAGGVNSDKGVFDPYSALYPPFSLVMLAPVATLPYPAAHAVWEALIAVTFSIAVLLVADLCVMAGAAAGVTMGVAGGVGFLPVFLSGVPVLLPVLVLAAFTVSSTILLMLGQVSGVVIALLAIAFCCLLRERFFWLSVVCLFIAVMLKPHDAALPLLYLLFAGPRWRKAFWVVALLSIVCASVSLAWFAYTPNTAHWLTELRANLQGNAAPGSVNNPARGHLQGMNLTDLQSIFAVVRDKASLYNNAAFLVSIALLGAWIVPVLRLRNTLSKHLLAIAAIACFTLLPIYHRQYDTRILLLAFPAVAYLLSRQGRGGLHPVWGRAWGWLGFALLSMATALTAHQYINHVLLRQQVAIEQASAGRTLLLYRPIPEMMLVLFLFFLASLYREMRLQGAGLDEGPDEGPDAGINSQPGQKLTKRVMGEAT